MENTCQICGKSVHRDKSFASSLEFVKVRNVFKLEEELCNCQKKADSRKKRTLKRIGEEIYVGTTEPDTLVKECDSSQSKIATRVRAGKKALEATETAFSNRSTNVPSKKGQEEKFPTVKTIIDAADLEVDPETASWLQKQPLDVYTDVVRANETTEAAVQIDPKQEEVSGTAHKDDLRNYGEAEIVTTGSFSGLLSVFLLSVIVTLGLFHGVRGWLPTDAPGSMVEEAAFSVPARVVARPAMSTLSPDLRAHETILERSESWLDYIATQMGDGRRNRELLPKSAWLSSKFGYRVDPFSRRWKFHHGLDIAMHAGERIKSFMPGQVAFAGWKKGFGNVVFIEHPFGLVTIYGHLSKVHVRKGQKIIRGSTIGKSGSTGRSTGPHLHFEMRLNDKRIDPNVIPQLAFLRKP